MRSLIAYLLFYPTLWYNQILCRIFSWRNWWDRIDEHLIIGALPMKRHVKPLHDEGIRAVVNTCNEYSGPLEHYNEHGIDQLRVPTVDFTPPSLEHVQQAVKLMKRTKEKQESTLLNLAHKQMILIHPKKKESLFL